VNVCKADEFFQASGAGPDSQTSRYNKDADPDFGDDAAHQVRSMSDPISEKLIA